jgi:hypothetical protein
MVVKRIKVAAVAHDMVARTDGIPIKTDIYHSHPQDRNRSIINVDAKYGLYPLVNYKL